MVAEVDFCRNDLILCMNNLNEWVKPEKVICMLTITEKLLPRAVFAELGSYLARAFRST